MPLPSGIYRRALVFGNSAYQNVTALRNPTNDAQAMGTQLEDLGFEVEIAKDVDAAEFRRAISVLCRQLGKATEAGQSCEVVVFFAGHGMQVDGSNYLLPVDCDIRSKFDLKQQAIELDVVLEALESIATSSVVLLDCCRNNPLPRTLGPAARSLAGAQGLANVRAPTGVYVAFSTQPHFVALDGTTDNSPFTESLLNHVATPGSHVSEVMMSVRREVYEKTDGQQIPWDHSALFEPFSFAEDGLLTRADGMSEEEWQKRSKAELVAREESYWQLVRQSEDLEFIQSFITQFPDSEHHSAAAARAQSLIMKRQRRRLMGWAVAGVFALFSVYLGLLFLGAQPLPNAEIMGGDIEHQYGGKGITSSLFGCRLRCVVTRFNRPCVAFSFDRKQGRCFLKHEAVFFARPQKLGTVDVDSEVMLGVQTPAQTNLKFFFDRALVGKYTNASVVLEKATGKALELIEDVSLNRSYWVISSGGACQRLCADIGEACKGFSFTQGNSHCEIFESVTSLMRDSVNKYPVFMDGTFSGFSSCTDSTALECKAVAPKPADTVGTPTLANGAKGTP